MDPIEEKRRKQREYMREYRKKNRDKVNRFKKNWVDQNKEAVKEYNRKYYQENKDTMIKQIVDKKKERQNESVNTKNKIKSLESFFNTERMFCRIFKHFSSEKS